MRLYYALVLALTVPLITSSAAAQTAPPDERAGRPSAQLAPPASPEARVELKPDNTVAGKWRPKLYGFIEADSMIDSTQSFGDLAGNAPIARPGSYSGERPRTTFGLRNSRLGFKLQAPDAGVWKTSALIEMDFLGNQPPNASEAGFFTSPTFRLRHAAIKVEDPYVNLLFGQYWSLFGWQSYFHPATVEIQGVPGQLYGRTPQVRLSRALETDPLNVELAVAAQRPVQRNAAIPDIAGGLRLLVNHWKALHTSGSTGTAVDPMSVGVSGLLRTFDVPEFVEKPGRTLRRYGWGVSADALIPIVPGSLTDRANALTLTGSAAIGSAIADQYTGLTGGVTFPSLPKPAGAASAPTYPADVDNGLVSFDQGGVLDTVDWKSLLVGVQYYLPPSGRLWLAANYSTMRSANARDFGDPTKVFNRSQWADANLFWDATDALRFGLEYAYFEQKYVDGVKARNHRGQFSAFFLF